MPFDLDLPKSLRQARWKVKIHDLETGLEEPHVTIYRKMRKWRYSLRSGEFLDQGDKWSQINAKIRKAIEKNLNMLKSEWDKIHPNNPVEGPKDEDDNDP